MKKLIFSLLAIVFSMSLANAQVTHPTKKKTDHSKSMTCYMMKDGKMYQSMVGKETLLEKEVTLKNGEKIMPDGMVKMKDGKQMTLKNEECIDARGNFHKSHQEHHKKA